MTTSTSTQAGPRKDETTGTWWFVVDLGPGPDGKRQQARRRGFATKRAAMEAMDRLRVSSRERTYVAPKRQTLGAFLLEDWLPAKRSTLGASTWESYGRNLRLHVVPALGGVQLQSLDPAQLNRLYADLLASERGNGRSGTLSLRTVRYIATILGAALNDAVRWGRLVRNPARLADPPSATSAKSPEMRTWDAATVARFLDLAGDDRYGPAWLFLATTGARRGEVLGLRWADLDLDAGQAAIRQTITQVGRRIVTAPRTKTGKARLIELDGRTVASLRAHRARQAAERLAMGAGFTDQGLVFALPDGRPYQPERFSREFARRLERYDLTRIRLHDLRHTWATLALLAGIPVEIVAERLGHSVAVCAATYRHVTPAMASGAAEKVAGLIFGQP